MKFLWAVMIVIGIILLIKQRARKIEDNVRQSSAPAKKIAKPTLLERQFAGHEAYAKTDVDFSNAFSRVKEMTENKNYQIFMATELYRAKPLNSDVVNKLLYEFSEQLTRYKTPTEFN